MQTNPDKYKTVFQSFRCILKEEGVVNGFYRGILPPLTALTILNMMNFTVYAKLCECFAFEKEQRVLQRVEPMTFLAGAGAGVSAAFVSTPFELVKIQMQLDSSISTSRQKNSISAARNIISTRGFSALYRGHAVNTTREMMFLGTYFFSYEHGKQLLTPLLPPTLCVAMAGGMSGALGWFISFPLDCVKANIQGAPVAAKQPLAFEVASRLLATKGIYGLYSGVAASIIRAFLVSSSRFTAYEFVQWLASTNSDEDSNFN
jgi:solute carrier family 25 (mitochondrial carnitine/acylcarnitine transporter), member 20/29